MSVVDAIPLVRDLPPAVTVALIAMVPVIELRGAIPVGLVLGLHPAEAFAAAVVGNLVPVPLLVWFLDPVQRFLSAHSVLFRHFFRWLFARTRTRHGPRYRKVRDIALISFVAVPLPGTGAYTGSAAAFVFGVARWRALALITFGVLLSGAAVTLFLATGQALVRR